MLTKPNLVAYIILLCLIGFTLPHIRGQKMQEGTKGVDPPPPKEEKFVPSQDLVGTWRSIGCGKIVDERPEHGCSKIEYSKEFQSSFVFTLYNSDGTIWWRASLVGEANHFWVHKNQGFQPFAINSKTNPDGIVLRMVAESKNWFEVEINERTRKTKYIWRKDPAWAKTPWEFWLKLGVTLRVPDKEEPFRDQPDGKVLDGSGSRNSDWVTFLKRDGDWAYVEDTNPYGLAPSRVRGWIRWRNGRELLVGCYLNNDDLPE